MPTSLIALLIFVGIFLPILPGCLFLARREKTHRNPYGFRSFITEAIIAPLLIHPLSLHRNNPFWVYPLAGLKFSKNQAGKVFIPVTKSVFSDKYDRFRQLLITARKQAGLTQMGLAKRLSRPQSFVSKYERGERRLDVIEFLEVARAIGVDPFEFLRVVDDSASTPTQESYDNKSWPL